MSEISQLNYELYSCSARLWEVWTPEYLSSPKYKVTRKALCFWFFQKIHLWTSQQHWLLIEITSPVLKIDFVVSSFMTELFFSLSETSLSRAGKKNLLHWFKGDLFSLQITHLRPTKQKITSNRTGLNGLQANMVMRYGDDLAALNKSLTPRVMRIKGEAKRGERSKREIRRCQCVKTNMVVPQLQRQCSKEAAWLQLKAEATVRIKAGLRNSGLRAMRKTEQTPGCYLLTCLTLSL